MQKKQFGKTDMQITPIGLGAWAIGGSHSPFGWGPQDDQESIATIRRALDLGINWIDTAAVYGLGHSEMVVGKAIKGRERPYIFTKCERVWDENGRVGHSLRADSIRREVEASLKRLDIDVIDLYQIHWPDPDPDIEEGWSTLAQLKKEGKVRHIGVSNFNVEQLRRAEKIAPVETLQPPYSLLRPAGEEEILPYCLQHNIGVIVYSPMASGLLTGKMTRERIANLPHDDWRSRNPEYQEPRLSRNLAVANLLGEIGKAHNVPTGVVAIAWVLHNPAVTAAIVGARHPHQIEELVPASEFRLSENEYEQIRQFVAQHP
jgi:aryl-alcohol dehydrogenase-like predicted oxidoreductase